MRWRTTRTAEPARLDELVGTAISLATLYNAVETAAERLETPATAIGAEAVRLAGELTPDVALIDVAMPGMNGIETPCMYGRSANRESVSRAYMVPTRKSRPRRRLL